MSLLEEAKAATPRKGPRCGVAVFLDEHCSPELRAEIIEVLHDPSCTDAGLIAALKGRGYDPPRAQVWGHHRRGGCKCEPVDG